MNTKKMVRIAMIAAIYTALSLALAPFTYGNIQVRIAEALTLLPLIYQPSIWGVTLGCFLTNLIGAIMGFNPTGIIDSVIGTTATLLAALCTYKFRDRKVGNVPVLSILMPVIFNFFFIGAELGYLLFPDNILVGSLICGAEVAVGELISVIFGWFIIKLLSRTKLFES
ncbi:MAG: QueT transporter family protein [Solobacterium sp.]|nr:QueT transporter family protein [Solobacterium sp.]MBR3126787.1 QueT transporter family protein [Solobacterium sp.]